MRSVGYGLLICLALAFPASAAFKPTFEQICTPAKIGPGEHGNIDPRRLIGWALKVNGITEIDLDTSGNEVSLPVKREAILDSLTYCGQKPGLCSKGTDATLSRVFIDLNNFTLGNYKGKNAADVEHYEIYRTSNPGVPITIRELLADRYTDITARCVGPAKSNKPDGPAQTEPKKPDKESVEKRFMIRKKVADLQYSQGDKQKFKGLDRASLGVVSNYLKDTVTYTFDGVAGVGLSHIELGQQSEADLVGYVLYSRQLVSGATPKNAKDVDNIGGGILTNIIFPAAGHYHGLQIYPQYVQSLVSEGQVFSTSLVYSPMTWPLVGQAGYIGKFAFVLTPQAKFVYGHVLDHGRDPDFIANKDFVRAGGRLELLVVADGGPFNGFSWRNAYEYQYGIRGFYNSVDRFESTLSYKFPDQQLWSMDLSYISGRNLDTLELQQQLTLGVGFKY